VEQDIKIGITFSSFDLFHAGHVAMLKESTQHCDYLIVGLQTNPASDRPDTKTSPIQSTFERYIQLNGCKYVDEIVPYTFEKEIADILLTFPISCRIIGEEYRDKDFSGKQLCIDKGIEIVYNNRQHSFSTTELKHRVIQNDKRSYP